MMSLCGRDFNEAILHDRVTSTGNQAHYSLTTYFMTLSKKDCLNFPAISGLKFWLKIGA